MRYRFYIFIAREINYGKETNQGKESFVNQEVFYNAKNVFYIEEESKQELKALFEKLGYKL